MQMISKDAKKEMDILINQIGDKFSDLVSLMTTNGINPNKLDFMKEIATIIDSGMNISQYYKPNKDQTYSNWIDSLEICEDTEIQIEIITQDARQFFVKAIYNLATNRIKCSKFPEEIRDIDSEEFSSVTFQWEGDTIQVCPECFEATIQDKTCSNCGHTEE